MPVRSSVAGATPAPCADYPKLMKGPSGTIWLLSGPKTGTMVHKGTRADNNIGYISTKLVATKLVPFTGELKLAA